MLLRVSNLQTWFHTESGAARAVDGVSFGVGQGEAVGITGESGSGKTATALSIMGLLPPASGELRPGSSIEYLGRELVGLPAREMRRVRGGEIAMVFQEPATSLNPVFTVGDQIAETARAHRGASRAEARRVAVALLQEVGFEDPARSARDYPHQLSGGMCQRVVLAMALAGEPRMIIADEPTAALDVTVQAQILALLGELRRRRGLAILLISHDLGVISEVCDRVLVMYAGQVVERGPVNGVLGGPSHPYTQALLDSLPRLGEGAPRLATIPGQAPDPVAWPEGCRFAERCPQSWEQCRENVPPLFEAPSPGVRASRCWLSEREGWRRGAP